MPSTIISRPGSLARPFSADSSADVDRLTDSDNVGAKGAFRAPRRRLERPRVQDARSQNNMAVAAFKRDFLRIDATVPHQRIRQGHTRRDLLDHWQISGAE